MEEPRELLLLVRLLPRIILHSTIMLDTPRPLTFRQAWSSIGCNSVACEPQELKLASSTQHDRQDLHFLGAPTCHMY